MKNLIVYYSLTGNTRFIADEIGKSISAEILELKPLNEINKTGFTRYLWGGSQVFLKKMPELKDYSIDPEKYDTIFIGTPVWAFTYSPPIRSFLTKISLNNCKIALFCTHGGQKGKIFQNFKSNLKNSKILGEIDLREPLKSGQDEKSKQAIEWAQNIIAQ